jgi:hypothetical protein
LARVTDENGEYMCRRVARARTWMDLDAAAYM